MVRAHRSKATCPLVLGVLLALLSLPPMVAAASELPVAPAFIGLHGKALSLDAYPGRLLLLNFWASWCGPCRQEMPDLQRLSRQLDPKQALIIGIAADDLMSVKSFVGKVPVSYPMLVGDPDAVFAWTSELGNVTQGLPYSVLIDTKGRIRWRQSGGRLAVAEVRSAIEKVLHDSAR